MLSMEFKDKLSKLCGERRWRAATLFRVVTDAGYEISKSSVENWFKGKQSPDLDAMMILSREFRVSIDYLAREDMEEVPDPAEREAVDYILWACKKLGVVPRDLVRSLVAAGIVKMLPGTSFEIAEGGTPPYAGFVVTEGKPAPPPEHAQEPPRSRNRTQG